MSFEAIVDDTQWTAEDVHSTITIAHRILAKPKTCAFGASKKRLPETFLLGKTFRIRTQNICLMG